MIEKTGELEIRISGSKGNLTLSPENFDIKEIQIILEKIEDLLFPINKKDRPLITYDLKEGSVKHIFKTGIQAIISFAAILSQINTVKSIDFLDLKTASAIESFQNMSYEKNYNFDIYTSFANSEKLIITPHTKFIRSENLWVDAEFYFYGVLTNAGGKNKANVHIDTKEYGLLTLETPKEFLAKSEANILYKNYGVRALGKQNIETGEMDKQSLKLLELLDYNSSFDETYLSSLINKARNNWENIDPDEWLHEIRGDYAL
jgi:hypothetical protein